MVGFVTILSEDFNLKQPKKKRKEYFYNVFIEKRND